MSGVLVLVLFLVFAAMMYARWMPAIVAVPLMAVTMSIAAGVPAAQLPGIITDGSKALADVYVAVIFGALLGRVTIDTGIARALVNLAAEYGGENPFALALVLCAVIALLFTSLSGLGAVIMVGSIVLPIMMTTGVPRKAAATLFLMAFALGFIFNIVNWKFYTKFFGVIPQQMVHYAILLAVFDALALVAYAFVAFSRERNYATWAVRNDAEEEATPGVPPWALLTPVLPIVLYYAAHVDATIAFIISAIYGVLVTRPRHAITVLVAAAIRGVEDVAPAVLLFIGIGMLLTATQHPQFAQALRPLVAGAWMHNPVAYVVLFGLASPLVLYRGPLNPFGVGIAIFTVLLGANVLPPVVLVAAVMAVVQVQNVCDPTNTANVWVANFTGVPIPEITRRTLPYQVGVATAATLAVAVASPALFGVQAFSSLIPPALAGEMPGFYAPTAAAQHIGVGTDGSPLANAAGDAVIEGLTAANMRAFRDRKDPNASDCSHKPYAAYVHVATSAFRLAEGTDLDVGLTLQDCGGWIVNEWHDHAVSSGTPSPDDARRLAAEGVARLEDWAAKHSDRSGSLFARGVAVAPGDPPTYFYTLFKTVDGYMRAYVRAGGPAYVAGLRTNDIVDKLDGKFWWEYGTYQTQLRAYDGRPHAFEVERNGRTIDVQLGDPFTGDEGKAT